MKGKKMTKKEVAKVEAEAHALANPMEEFEVWGAENVESRDLRIPRLYLMQPMSELVGEGKAQPSEVISSVTSEVIVPKNGQISFVPIYMFKDWQITQKVGNKFEYLCIEPYTPTNAGRPWDFEIGGVAHQANQGFNFLVMLEKDLGQPGSLPYMLTLRRSSFKAGQDISLKLQQATIAKLPACAMTIQLAVKQGKKDKGLHFVYSLEKSSPTPNLRDVVNQLKPWYDMIKQGTGVVVDEEKPAEATEETINGAIPF